ncbi:unnamed protein product [Spirodela intermedia]|uniref:Uncharacterized protein n=1 Tax=Spirodela intermedia TaxID=51605 RepID=A0A7I8IL78_SPIIN|nr:unnamed protein product [Spirodela intermedia]CAA6658673.1 unnamed protein product [Spirodela intermedia]
MPVSSSCRWVRRWRNSLHLMVGAPVAESCVLVREVDIPARVVDADVQHSMVGAPVAEPCVLVREVGMPVAEDADAQRVMVGGPVAEPCVLVREVQDMVVGVPVAEDAEAQRVMVDTPAMGMADIWLVVGGPILVAQGNVLSTGGNRS